MTCHECARRSLATPAVGQCRFCCVGLCKDHLVESLRSDVVPQYACRHRPERPFDNGRPVKNGRPRVVGGPLRLTRAANSAGAV
jgi:hypothetical protein